MIAGAKLIFRLVQSVNVKIQNVHDFEELAFDQTLSDGFFVNKVHHVVGVHLIFHHLLWYIFFFLLFERLFLFFFFFLFLFSLNPGQNSIQKDHVKVNDDVLVEFEHFLFEFFKDEVVGRETILFDEFEDVVRQVWKDEWAEFGMVLDEDFNDGESGFNGFGIRI